MSETISGPAKSRTDRHTTLTSGTSSPTTGVK